MSNEPKEGSVTAPQEPLKLTPGRRYLIREGAWSAHLEEVRIVARSKTGVYIEHEGGNRRWHMLAYAGVGKWVIEEDLGPWEPGAPRRDDAAELRAALAEVMRVIGQHDDRGPHILPTPVWQRARAALAATEGRGEP